MLFTWYISVAFLCSAAHARAKGHLLENARFRSLSSPWATFSGRGSLAPMPLGSLPPSSVPLTLLSVPPALLPGFLFFSFSDLVL